MEMLNKLLGVIRSIILNLLARFGASQVGKVDEEDPKRV